VKKQGRMLSIPEIRAVSGFELSCKKKNVRIHQARGGERIKIDVNWGAKTGKKISILFGGQQQNRLHMSSRRKTVSTRLEKGGREKTIFWNKSNEGLASNWWEKV